MTLETTVRTAARRSPFLRAAVVRFRHRDLHEDDVLVAAYPKSGTTWLTFMLAQLLLGEEGDFESTRAAIPMIGIDDHAPATLPGGGRVFRTHEPFGPVYDRHALRVVYVARDGRDVAVSYYHYQQRRGLFDGTLSEFLHEFLAGRVDGYSPWHRHVESWLASPLSDDDFMLLVRYEQLHRNPLQELARVASFLKLDTDEESLLRAVEANRADRMREKEQRSAVLSGRAKRDIPFVRHAGPGASKDEFSDEDRRLFDTVAGDALARLGYAD